MGKIIVLGSINMDVVVTAPRHPELGETIFGDELHFIPGGKGSNQAVAASRLDGDVQLVGRLGQDAFGDTLEAFLRDESLDLAYLQRTDGEPTGTALITVNRDSENTIVVISGANMANSPDDVEQVALSGDEVLVSQFEVPQPTLKALFERGKAAGAQTVLNPAPAGEFVPGLLDLIDYLIVNETELAFFAGTQPTKDIDAIIAAAQKLRARPDQTIIVTLGAGGSVCLHGDNTIRVEGLNVDAVDTTGAGDCFVGAFAVAIAEGKSVRAALDFANRAAALSVQRLGAATSLPHRHELDS